MISGISLGMRVTVWASAMLCTSVLEILVLKNCLESSTILVVSKDFYSQVSESEPRVIEKAVSLRYGH